MIYLFVFFLSLLLTYTVREIAIKKAVMDIPNHRSSHDVPTPRGGGVAIVISFYVGLFWLYHTGVLDERLFYSLLFALPVATVGLVDDIVNISASKRFFIQTVSAVGALYILDLTSYFFIPSLLVILWFTNLFNFLDGIDGYVSSQTIFISLVAFVLFDNFLFLILAAAVLGFLPFNWQRASIFMGDTGSTFIGFTIGIFFLYFSKDYDDVLIWLLITSAFWFDATYTLFRRLFNHERITKAHRKHLFQRAVRGGLSHRFVTLTLLGIDLLIFASIFFLRDFKEVALLSFISIFFVLSKIIDKRVSFYD